MKFTVTGFSFVCFVVVMLFFSRLENRRAGVPLVLAFLGTGAYVVSSVVNGTPLLAPNVPAFPAVALYLCGLLVLTANLAELFAVMAGVSIGTLGFYAVLGTALTSDGIISALWKYGFAPSVTFLVLYTVAQSRRDRPLLACSALVVLAAVSIVLNFRSHALICLAAALLVVIDRVRRRPTALPIKLITIAVVGGVTSTALEYAARAGLLGSALTDKVESQAAQHVPSLLVGRSEPPLSITAILDHPLLGWGYADNISSAVFDRAYQLAVHIGFDPAYPFQYIWRLQNGSVSLHSILLGSWAEGGVVAVLFPTWLAWACIRLIHHAHRHPSWAPLLTFVGIQGLWDLLFSPWSYNVPITYAGIATASLFLATDRGASVPRLFKAPPMRLPPSYLAGPGPGPEPDSAQFVGGSPTPPGGDRRLAPRPRLPRGAVKVDSHRQTSPPGNEGRRAPTTPSVARGPRHAASERSSR